MEMELLLTADGSHTLYVPHNELTYHSKHGAMQESMHVFIEAGLRFAMKEKNNLKIFEMGFGTGLNALLSYVETQLNNISIDYQTIETTPVHGQFINLFNFVEHLGKPELKEPFRALHHAAFEEKIFLSPSFSFTKFKCCINEFSSDIKYDVIFFDAFAPNAQPEIWTQQIFEKLMDMMEPGGCLVTYCSKGIVRRAMIAAGLTVTKLQGPPGKREMIRAIKQS